jgi:hypothetical protein
MIEQSIPLNFTIANLARLCQNLRDEIGDLTESKITPSALIYDVMAAIGLPNQAIRLVLTEDECAAVELPAACECGCMDYVACQICGGEAIELVKARYGWVLVCEDCKIKIKHC